MESGTSELSYLDGLNGLSSLTTLDGGEDPLFLGGFPSSSTPSTADPSSSTAREADGDSPEALPSSTFCSLYSPSSLLFSPSLDPDWSLPGTSFLAELGPVVTGLPSYAPLLLPGTSGLLPCDSDDLALLGGAGSGGSHSFRAVKKKRRRSRARASLLVTEEDRKDSRTWAARVGKEDEETARRRMERNRIRMAEKRAAESTEERDKRLVKGRIYHRNKILKESESQRFTRREKNRMDSAARRGRMSEEKTLEKSLRMLVDPSSICLDEEREFEEDRRRRLTSGREYAAMKRARESPEQKAERLLKNRERMRASRAARGAVERRPEWTAYMQARKAAGARLDLLRSQLGSSQDPSSPLATVLTAALGRLAELIKTQEEGEKPVVSAVDSFLGRVTPVLRAMEDGLSRRDDDGYFLFGAEVSYLDYALYEELDALGNLSSTVIDDYPALNAYKGCFIQRLSFTTYALMRAAERPVTFQEEGH